MVSSPYTFFHFLLRGRERPEMVCKPSKLHSFLPGWFFRLPSTARFSWDKTGPISPEKDRRISIFLFLEV